jgi:uncharacterized membrane protein
MNALSPSEFDVAHLIQLAVAPVFLLAGVAATLNVLTSRLGRIVDRARPLEQQLESTSDEIQFNDLSERLRVMGRRSRYINAALTLATVAGILVAAVVLLLFFGSYARIDLSMATAIVFVTAILCLALALLSFLVEVRIATVSLRIGLGLPKQPRASG